jgi:hypothetical protein
MIIGWRKPQFLRRFGVPSIEAGKRLNVETSKGRRDEGKVESRK